MDTYVPFEAVSKTPLSSRFTRHSTEPHITGVLLRAGTRVLDACKLAPLSLPACIAYEHLCDKLSEWTYDLDTHAFLCEVTERLRGAHEEQVVFLVALPKAFVDLPEELNDCDCILTINADPDVCTAFCPRTDHPSRVWELLKVEVPDGRRFPITVHHPDIPPRTTDNFSFGGGGRRYFNDVLLRIVAPVPEEALAREAEIPMLSQRPFPLPVDWACSLADVTGVCFSYSNHMLVEWIEPFQLSTEPRAQFTNIECRLLSRLVTDARDVQSSRSTRVSGWLPESEENPGAWLVQAQRAFTSRLCVIAPGDRYRTFGAAPPRVTDSDRAQCLCTYLLGVMAREIVSCGLHLPA